MVKKIFIGIGVSIALVLGIGYYRVTRPPAPPGLPAGVPPEITLESSEAAARLETKIETFQQEIQAARAKGEKREVTLVITEGELNSMISKQLAVERPAGMPADLNLEEVKVYFREDRLHFSVRVIYGIIEVPVTITADIVIREGTPTIEVKSTDVGRVPLPGAVTDRLTQVLTQQLEGLGVLGVLDLPIEVTNVVIRDGQLTIVGVTK
jgi:hypothetical protein